MSYKTTLKAFDILRKAIVKEHSECDEILKGEVGWTNPIWWETKRKEVEALSGRQ